VGQMGRDANGRIIAPDNSMRAYGLARTSAQGEIQ
jgi:hypothetical protein